MSKAVLISIRPEWCEKISSGEKTIEVRKTRPKLTEPFKCYICCTTSNPNDPHKRLEIRDYEHDTIRLCNGKVIGEFVCDEIYDWHCGYDSRYDTNCLVAMTCLDAGELYAYGQGKPLYGWHISELQIYDKPKELSEFYRREKVPHGAICAEDTFLAPIYSPPQSWCYVEELT